MESIIKFVRFTSSLTEISCWTGWRERYSIFLELNDRLRFKKKKKRLFLRQSNFQPWNIGDIWLKRCKFSAKRDTINPRLKIGAPMEIIIWVSERRREGRWFEARSDWISVCTGTWTEYRSSKGRWHSQERKKERERERWPLKSPKIFHRMGQDRYSRSATNHFEEVTNFSFSSSLPLSSSSYLHPLVALDLNSPSKEVSPWWIFSVMSGRCSRSINVIHRRSPSQIVRVTISKIATGTE